MEYGFETAFLYQLSQRDLEYQPPTTTPLTPSPSPKEIGAGAALARSSQPPPEGFKLGPVRQMVGRVSELYHSAQQKIQTFHHDHH